MKYCERYDVEAAKKRGNAVLENRDPTASAAQELFNRTLAFFCVLHDKGCAFDSDVESNDDPWGASLGSADSDDDTDSDSDQEMGEPRRMFDRTKTCSGKIKICYHSRYNRPYLQCDIYFISSVKFLSTYACFIGVSTKKPTILSTSPFIIFETLTPAICLH